jgi:hypothetical protein
VQEQAADQQASAAFACFAVQRHNVRWILCQVCGSIAACLEYLCAKWLCARYFDRLQEA